MTDFASATMTAAEFARAHGKPPNGEAQTFNFAELCLSPAEWEAHEIEPRTRCSAVQQTTRSALTANTGLGKTMRGLALAHAKAIGRDFLH